ncbi:hypothetical protein AVEN_223252-1 [Araneus ventricosus]|uniref:Uncharacterized protein n=1 Tax=Araneus ventricosus TaxID=182803 RepID=A0A4Y2NHT2_ARAVE|nr:hypothetical protein AVEN_223252-1 [Araneus ventricosus]
MKAIYSYVYGIQEVDGGDYDMTGLRTTSLAKSIYVSVVNGQFAISESHLKAILSDHIFEEDCKKELFGFQVLLMCQRRIRRIVNRTFDFKWKNLLS